MPWPGLPSLSVNPSLSMVILQDLLFLYQVVADAKAIPSCSMALAAFSASARCLSPFTCSKCMLSRDGKMGCSALETGCVHSSLGMIFPAEGPVWVTLALSPNEGLMPSLSNVMPCGGGRTRGLSSIHPPEAPPLPGLSTAGRAGASPSLCWRGFQGVLAHVVSILPGLIACWVALVCPEPRSAASVGCKSPILGQQMSSQEQGRCGEERAGCPCALPWIYAVGQSLRVQRP